jgi:hypothetical protein
MADQDDKMREKLYWYVGTIISATTVIESALAWKIRMYFFPKSNRQAGVFHQHILSARYFNLDRKIELFKQIPNFKKIKNYKKILDSLRYIQKIRNAVAHFEVSESNGTEIVIFDPNTFRKTSLNDRLIREFVEHDKFLLKALGWRYSLAGKYGGRYPSPDSHSAEIRAMARYLSKFFRS